MTASRIAVFASGGGSNLEALLQHLDAVGGAQVVLVLSNKPDAGAVAKAARRGIATHVIADPADGNAIVAVLDAADVGTIALAGYLKMIPEAVTRRWRGRMLNVHPSLLPAFGGHGMYGRRVHEAVIAAKTSTSGATVHFVDEVYDRGPILAQASVPVRPDDTAVSLAERVLGVEHQLFPRAVHALATGVVELGPDGRVHGVVPAVPSLSS
ncbi:MAG: phosphoribosylglycinamide formyltransferase [Gemmatimonadaceae bacterium]|nr:phosphoribosylglycinamide formyltransferase [Gemmatimonadaceae bacterium]